MTLLLHHRERPSSHCSMSASSPTMLLP